MLNEIQEPLKELFGTYLAAGLKNGYSEKDLKERFSLFIELVKKEFETPYRFELFHESLREPFDYFRFGIDFMLPLVEKKTSLLEGKKSLKKIVDQLAKKENAVFFANHQTEPDPQFLSILLEKEFPTLAKDIIFVAGHRVLEDPLAIPFSKGRRILSIYSKRHMSRLGSEKTEKIQHNKKTVIKLRELLDEGGKAIYVAPSGGRDRPNEKGHVFPSPLDPDSLELFYLLGKASQNKTRFYPLALATHKVFPPPPIIEKKIGERRVASLAPIRAYFGEELFSLPLDPAMSKQTARRTRKEQVETNILYLYKKLLSF